MRESSKLARAALLLGLAVMLGITALSWTPVRSGPGTIFVRPGDFSTIQAAVDAASPGDTIIVSPGTYLENVKVSKSLNLTGLSRGSTVIDADQTGPGIKITSTSQVTISGFTINNTGDFDAVIVYSSSKVGIFRNMITASAYSNGTYIANSVQVAVKDNIIAGNQYGVSIQGGGGNLVQRNNLTVNGVGVTVFASQSNQIKDNYVAKGESGLDLRDGSVNNVIARNTIANNTSTGLLLQNASGNVFAENSIEFNKAIPQVTAGYAISLENARGNSFYYNNIRNNTRQVFAQSSTAQGDLTLNRWNDGSASPRGNFWSDYAGLDNGSGYRIADDGVGDTLLPHPCPTPPGSCSFAGPAGVDNYPLILPFQAPALNVTATADVTTGFQPLTVSFTGTVAGGNSPYDYAWNLGDGSTLSGQNVTYTYQTVGYYVASLTVTDDSGLSRSDLVAITAQTRPSTPPSSAPNYTLVVLWGIIIPAGVVGSLGFLVLRQRRRIEGPPAGSAQGSA